MKSIVSKYLVISLLPLLTCTSSLFAGSDLPVSKQKTEKADKGGVEIIPEIKIDAKSSTSSPKNSKLKQGKACDFSDLEEAEGELIVEIPMAKTIPCDTVDCKKLKPAKLLKDSYVELKTVDTIKGCDK